MLRETIMSPPEKMQAILPLLQRLYPKAHCTLDFADPLQLLVSTILSAQCTDERVNLVTPAVFQKYRTAADYAAAPLEDLEEAFHATGFFRQKAKSIKQICQTLVERFAGQIPPSLEELVKFPGIGRKTANVILGNAFGIPGIVVDTHVGRVSRRLGLTTNKDPVKIEFDLMALVPQEDWTDFSHQLIWHGRQVCMAKKPRCTACALLPYCNFGQKQQ
ncbi:endonuclease III [Desulfobacca acetoxidans DSM 11109]|uniref:Endonuclease III n=2 Tax=Desulfobacca acetoxidans TaxID=60893 RepID=F2NIG7_DESAR|nr:endonuclease III [Desulfobacca acetoxidans DSM 11109]